jgi:hypothetical protein
MLKNKFLFVPIIIILLSIGIDRILLLEKIQTYYTRTVSELNFFHKPILFLELKDYLKQKERKKVLVYFGSSRGLLFNNKYIEEKYPDWVLFNFSVPGGSPDYFLFWLLQFQKDNVKPDFVLLDNTLEAFNLTPTIKIDECINNGLESWFLIKYFNRFSRDEVTNFAAKRLFKTYQYRPKLDVVISRIKNNFQILNWYRGWRVQAMRNIIINRGSASAELSENKTSPEEIIERFAAGDYNSYMIPFTFHEARLDFQADNLNILNSMNIPHAGIWVRIAPLYLDRIKSIKQKQKDGSEKTAFEIWKPKMDELFKKYNSVMLDMNDEPNYKCNAFTDASHMSSECYPDYTDFIFEKLQDIHKKTSQ